MFAGPDIEGLTARARRDDDPGDRERWRRRRSPTSSRCAPIEVDGRRLAGVIVGRALYEGRLDIEEAIAACSQPA